VIVPADYSGSNPPQAQPRATLGRSLKPSGRAMNVPRKLAAILAADVAGYSRLTGLDEEGTLKRCARFAAS